MESKGKGESNAGARGPRPWGQALLRAKAMEILREGSLAPSTVMGNLMAAAAAPIVDVELLAVQPRAMSAEANRVIADALRRSRLPNADVGAILDELVSMAWRPKAPQIPTRPTAPPARKPALSSKGGPRRDAAKSTPAPPAKAPVIVRRGSKLSDRLV